MTKKIYLLITLTLAVNACFAQSAFSWAVTAGGSLPDVSKNIATDAQGNSYITGDFRSAAIAFGATTFTSPGTTGHMYLAKYDASGNALWSINAAGPQNYGLAVATDNTGNVYLAGNFSNSITIGSSTLHSGGALDIFLAKFDGAGNLLWLKRAGGAGPDFPAAITTDHSGNVYMCGRFSMYPLVAGTFTVHNHGQFDVFVARFDTSGNAMWLNGLGDSMPEDATDIAVDISGNVYVGGNFESDSLTSDTFMVKNMGPAYQDLFLAKYDNNGIMLWLKGGGGSNSESISSIATFSNSVYVCGQFGSTVLSMGTFTLSNNGFGNMFVAKYDADGNVMWAKKEGGSRYDQANCITTDAMGHIFVGGAYSSTAITLGGYSYGNAGNYDMSLVEYDGSGATLWWGVAGGPGDDFLNSAGASNTDIYITGNYTSASLKIAAGTFVNAGGDDIFVAKLSQQFTGIPGTGMVKNEINIYPNPCSGMATVQCAQIKNGDIKIFDLTGSLIYAGRMDGRVDLDLTGLSRGIYLVQVRNDNQVMNQRLVKE
jgi:hypothetical protein